MRFSNEKNKAIVQRVIKTAIQMIQMVAQSANIVLQQTYNVVRIEPHEICNLFRHIDNMANETETII